MRFRSRFKRKPTWLTQPSSIQLDTHNYCNLKCEYCNVQGSFNLPRGEMPLETVEYVLKYFGERKTKLWCVAPFMNGEPLLDNRLPQIMDLAEQYCKTSCVIDTNATIYENRQFLLHPNLRLVRFTISAATAETYEKVHGKPFLDKALATFYWFLKHKRPNQKAWLHFIATKNNIHELDLWINRFKGVGRTVFPVHSGILQNTASQVQLKEFHSFLEDASPNEPFAINEKNKVISLQPWRNKKFAPCQCWDVISIGWNGEIMQCMDFPYRYNYGKVGETDLLEAWRRRIQNRMDNPCCKSCTVRLPNWKKIMDRWIH